MFHRYLLGRNIRYQDDLIDQLFNPSEKRLARVLLLMAQFGKEGVSEMTVPRLSQETLAEMVGTTRSRVSFFMNRFRKLGFINYDTGNNLQVHNSLLNIVLRDEEEHASLRTAGPAKLSNHPRDPADQLTRTRKEATSPQSLNECTAPPNRRLAFWSQLTILGAMGWTIYAAVLILLPVVRPAVNDGCGVRCSLSWLSKKLISPPSRMAKAER
jgi:hypothetical protein